MKSTNFLFVVVLVMSAVWIVWHATPSHDPSINQPTATTTNTTSIEHLSRQLKSEVNTLADNTQRASRTISSGMSRITSEIGGSVTEKSPTPPLVKSARQQLGVTIYYDPAYVKLDFPMGDVPADRGVCTDVVVRAYRNLDNGQSKDLQALVNADMKRAWNKYPKRWGLKSTDKNIDHRRVPNLRVFFQRHGKSLGVSQQASDYQAGDLVTWKVAGRPHIGIVSNKVKQNGTPLIIHNIGAGTQEEDILFDYEITGHYRY